MSKLSIRTEHKNYLAKVVKLGELRKHPGADKLQIAFIDGQNVITGLNAKEGDIYIYFPLESRLNSDYLSWSNSYSKAELNNDKTIKGFFPSVSRVKTAKLRGIYSEGYIVPVQSLVDWLNSIKVKALISDFEVGTEFSHFGETFIADKYINFDALRRAQNAERNTANKKGKVKRESKLVDNQFRLHIDTAPLKKNLSAICPDDFISISEKIHGCVDRETLIKTLEYGDITIGEIVDNKLFANVLAYDTKFEKEVWAEITDHYFYKDSDDWYEIELENGVKIEITGNNPVWMKEFKCYKRVDLLEVGDQVLFR